MSLGPIPRSQSECRAVACPRVSPRRTRMAAAARTGRSTRRDFMRLAGLGGGAIVLTSGSWGRRARAPALKWITAPLSMSTLVCGQRLVAAQKKFFEEEGVRTPGLVVPGGGAKV